MKPEILSRRSIKPTSPTPSHLQTYKFSLLDQIHPALHGNMTFFYSADTKNYNDTNFSDKSQLLQNSLSKALKVFHPFAGRIRDASSVDCNDEGAIFVEAKIDTQLSNFLDQPDYDLINKLLPTSDPETMQQANDALLLIQFTSFSCGGLAMSLSLTHKIADIAAMLTFLHSWTAIARNCDPLVPDWTGTTILPPMDNLSSMSMPVAATENSFEVKRVHFSATKIEKLKEKATAKGMQHHPSRVEVVLALLWKCVVAANKAKSGYFKPSALFQAVNLRNRTTPPLPDTIIGNFIGGFMVMVQDEKDMEIHELVIKMRKAFNDFCSGEANKYRGEEGRLMILEGLKGKVEFLKNNKDLNVFQCTSWCRFPLYDTDFGWGNPLWHASVNKIANNTIALADTRSRNGIEAAVTLNVEEMAMFERNEELLEFATLNPSPYNE